MNEKEIREKIETVLGEQKLAVLSTQRNGQPYSSLMAYGYTDDLREIVVATGRATRKHQNIVEDSRVSLLIDNRSNNERDFHEAQALTILGVARNIEPDELEPYEKLYLARHPYLQKFITSPTTAMFKICIHHYLVASHFQDVTEYQIEDGSHLFT